MKYHTICNNVEYFFWFVCLVVFLACLMGITWIAAHTTLLLSLIISDFFSQLDTLPLPGCYFSGTSCNFHFGQMFSGFLTSSYFSVVLIFTTDICDLAHVATTLLCIKVRLSEGRYLFVLCLHAWHLVMHIF